MRVTVAQVTKDTESKVNSTKYEKLKYRTSKAALLVKDAPHTSGLMTWAQHPGPAGPAVEGEEPLPKTVSDFHTRRGMYTHIQVQAREHTVIINRINFAIKTGRNIIRIISKMKYKLEWR